MNSYRITHTDTYQRRRRLTVKASSRIHAVAWVEQLYGDGWATSAVRVLEAG